MVLRHRYQYQAGRYTFWTYSDDGSKLYIDNKQLVNNDGLHGWRGRSGSKSLSAGAHAFKATMFERGGHHGMEVKYKGADTSNRVRRIPASAFAGKSKKQSTQKKAASSGLKEEVYYNIRNMRKVPNLSSRHSEGICTSRARGSRQVV